MKIKDLTQNDLLGLIELELLPDADPDTAAEEAHILLLKTKLKHYVAAKPLQEAVVSERFKAHRA